MKLAPRRAMGLLILCTLAGRIGLSPARADAPPEAMPEHHRMEDMPPSDEMPGMTMPGMLGPFTMSREASGTSWQPDSTPVSGIEHMGAPWSTMWDGFANLLYDHQGGPRGQAKTVSTSMLMFMGRRDVDDGAWGMRLMGSADALMGRNGYPELFQTGETADGVHPLIDRQHPHNLLMEAAASYSRNLSDQGSVFVYAGIAGEPALGPPAFMHRFSGVDDPLAPLGHHWLDATHISYGVVTAGTTWNNARLETSAFNGREPNQNRYQVELRRLDSNALRVSWNPLPDLSLQASSGRLASPEQLQPGTSVRRTTASASYNARGDGIVAQTTLAWGRNVPEPGNASNAWLLEAAVRVGAKDTVFARVERVGKDELFLPGQPLYGQMFSISSFSVGYVRDFARLQSLRIGVGGVATIYRFAAALNPSYGDGPVSGLLFLRVRL